jgi:choline monooxygenase
MCPPRAQVRPWIMKQPLHETIDSYHRNAPLERASTIPASWYTDQRIFELERQTVFSNSWQFAARLDQLRDPGDYVTTDFAGEPVVIVRGNDNELRGFFNVCRHHAAAVMTEAQGHAHQMRCPYHGWTYSLEGELKGTPDFSGVCDFDRAQNGLVPIEIDTWEKWILARVGGGQHAPLNDNPEIDLREFVGADLIDQFRRLNLSNLHWFERRRYTLRCNWKVFVDNYLDGGYHVPHLHKGLDSVLDYSNYIIENGERFCLQSSPMVNSAGNSPPLNHAHQSRGGLPPAGDVSSVRTGERARYYWLYPNFMINLYEGVMDTNFVRPLAVDRTEVIFDFYFADVSESARESNVASINVGECIQQEDVDICESVQRGLTSRAYHAGRLSVRREAGEHLFHRLLYGDLKVGVDPGSDG